MAKEYYLYHIMQVTEDVWDVKKIGKTDEWLGGNGLIKLRFAHLPDPYSGWSADLVMSEESDPEKVRHL